MKLPENRISGEQKNKIHSLWKIFLTGGIYQESGSSKQTVNSAIRRLEGEDIFDLTHFKGKSKQEFPAENGKRFAIETVARIYEAESRAFVSRTEEEINSPASVDSFPAQLQALQQDSAPWVRNPS